MISCVEASNRPSPVLSIVIPTYRRQRELERCLSSVMDAATSGVEILVSDNDPTDTINEETVRRVGRGQISYWKNTSNLGPIGNLHKLMTTATGEWIMTLTDDDIVYADGFRLMLDVLKNQRDIGVLISRRRCLKEDRSAPAGPDVDLSDEKLPAGGPALCRIIPAAHILSGLAIRRVGADLDSLQRYASNLYPQMYLAGALAKEYGAYFMGSVVVGHTIGNHVFWSYSPDYMVGGRLLMFKDLLPGSLWRSERRLLKHQLLDEVIRFHIPAAFSIGIKSGIRHQMAILRNPAISLSSWYWFRLLHLVCKRIYLLLPKICKG